MWCWATIVSVLCLSELWRLMCCLCFFLLIYKNIYKTVELVSTAFCFTVLDCVSIILHTDLEGLHFSLDDVGVYLSNSVDGVRSHDAQVRHVHPLASILFNQRHLPQFVHVFWKECCDPLQWRSRHRHTFRMIQSIHYFSFLRRVSNGAYVEVDLVDLVDDLQVSGQEGLQQIYRPALQSFGEDCVVGVGKSAPSEVPGLQRRGITSHLRGVVNDLWTMQG